MVARPSAPLAAVPLKKFDRCGTEGVGRPVNEYRGVGGAARGFQASSRPLARLARKPFLQYSARRRRTKINLIIKPTTYLPKALQDIFATLPCRLLPPALDHQSCYANSKSSTIWWQAVGALYRHKYYQHQHQHQHLRSTKP